mmetsp:Transcript_13757/g.32450  ORF Transcript_13757/g.32450 Transcript_13757/m.32450 type:complete len:248 (+) Transcript_13757:718-1461(+)
MGGPERPGRLFWPSRLFSARKRGIVNSSICSPRSFSSREQRAQAGFLASGPSRSSVAFAARAFCSGGPRVGERGHGLGARRLELLAELVLLLVHLGHPRRLAAELEPYRLRSVGVGRGGGMEARTQWWSAGAAPDGQPRLLRGGHGLGLGLAPPRHEGRPARDSVRQRLRLELVERQLQQLVDAVELRREDDAAVEQSVAENGQRTLRLGGCPRRLEPCCQPAWRHTVDRDDHLARLEPRTQQLQQG